MSYAAWSVVFGEQPSAAKWNMLGTNDASFNDGTGIAAGAITPEKLVSGAGTSWVWQSWVPTLANLSGGTLNYAEYTQIGKTVFFRFKYTLGGAGVGTDPSFTLPKTATANAANSALLNLIGRGVLQDTGTRQFFADVYVASTTTAKWYTNTSDSTYAYTGAVTSTIPHTWAATDILTAAGVYEAA